MVNSDMFVITAGQREANSSEDFRQQRLQLEMGKYSLQASIGEFEWIKTKPYYDVTTDNPILAKICGSCSFFCNCQKTK